jgi:ABC-type cobalamin/Fe3+-siderophores transport system ATPase subunit
MDIAGQHALMELIYGLYQTSSLTVLMSTHSLALVANYARKLMILHADNNVFETGNTVTLLTPERLRQIYGLDITVHSVAGSKQVVVHREVRGDAEPLT